jgi:hypothetical protein
MKFCETKREKESARFKRMQNNSNGNYAARLTYFISGVVAALIAGGVVMVWLR